MLLLVGFDWCGERIAAADAGWRIGVAVGPRIEERPQIDVRCRSLTGWQLFSQQGLVV